MRLQCRGANTGAIWSVQCCPSNGLVAYAGEDGIVAIFKERMLQDNRMRRAHTTVAGRSDLSVNLAPSNPHLPLCSMNPFMNLTETMSAQRLPNCWQYAPF